jgi:hypothetical protein
MTMNTDRPFQPVSASGAIFVASLVFFGLFFCAEKKISPRKNHFF